MADEIARPQSIDAAKASGLILLLQVLGSLALILAGMLLYFIIDSCDSTATSKLVGLVFLGVAVIIGLVGIWGSIPFDIIELSKLDIVPSLNNLFVMGTVLCFILASIVGVWGSRMYTDVGKLESVKLLLVVLFSFMVLCFLELASTSNHLYGIKKFAKTNNLKKENLNLNLLSGKYLIWFMVLFSIIFIYSWFVIDLQNVIIKMMGEGYTISPFSIEGMSHQFANSLILNSIYGVTLSMAIVFIPFIILVALLFGGERKDEEEFETEEM